MKCKMLSLFSLVILFQACGPSTKIEKSWSDPELTPGNVKPFQKILFVALLKDESTRRIAEDKMVAASAAKGVQSYSYFTSDDLKMTDDQLSAKLRNDGFDGIVVTRLADVDQTQTYVPGTSPSYYGTWAGYYRYGYGTFYDPGYYRTDKTYLVETNIYSLEQNKLLWSGTTSTVNPTNSSKMIDETVAVIKDELKKKGFIK